MSSPKAQLGVSPATRSDTGTPLNTPSQVDTTFLKGQPSIPHTDYDLSPFRICVVKIGSNSLVTEDGGIDTDFLDVISAQFAQLIEEGWSPILVSSGAVAVGVDITKRDRKHSSIPERQAFAAIGQIGVTAAWQAAFAKVQLLTAQFLLTFGDFSEYNRNANLRASLRVLLQWQVIPIINENDPISTEELTIGDNDHLASVLASQVGARQLVLLTDIDGVYDADPRKNPDAKRLREIPLVTAEHVAAAGGAGARGRGGMRTKVEGARIAAAAGVSTVIALAKHPNSVLMSVHGDDIGTRVPAQASKVNAHKRWLALARRVEGKIIIDSGAALAISGTNRKNLLLPGVVSFDGDFEIGGTISICAQDGTEVARGLASFASRELSQVLGMSSAEADSVLGTSRPAVVTRHDMLVLEEVSCAHAEKIKERMASVASGIDDLVLDT